MRSSARSIIWKTTRPRRSKALAATIPRTRSRAVSKTWNQRGSMFRASGGSLERDEGFPAVEPGRFTAQSRKCLRLWDAPTWRIQPPRRIRVHTRQRRILPTTGARRTPLARLDLDEGKVPDTKARYLVKGLIDEGSMVFFTARQVPEELPRTGLGLLHRTRPTFRWAAREARVSRLLCVGRRTRHQKQWRRLRRSFRPPKRCR